MIRKLSVLAAIAVAGLLLSPPARAWWVYGPRAGIYLPPVVIAPPAVYPPPVAYGPPPVVYGPPAYGPPVVYAAPPRVWVPGAWVRGVWVPPHWS